MLNNYPALAAMFGGGPQTGSAWQMPGQGRGYGPTMGWNAGGLPISFIDALIGARNVPQMPGAGAPQLGGPLPPMTNGEPGNAGFQNPMAPPIGRPPSRGQEGGAGYGAPASGASAISAGSERPGTYGVTSMQPRPMPRGTNPPATGGSPVTGMPPTGGTSYAGSPGGYGPRPFRPISGGSAAGFGGVPRKVY